MAFRDDAQRLIQEKNFDELESVWMTQLDEDPSDVDTFLAVAKSLRKAEQRTQSDRIAESVGRMSRPSRVVPAWQRLG